MQKSVVFTATVLMVLLVLATNFFTNQTAAVRALSIGDAGTNEGVNYDAGAPVDSSPVIELPEIWTREPGRVPEVRKKNYAFTICILYATFFSSLSIIFMLVRFKFVALVCMVLTIFYVMLFVLIGMDPQEYMAWAHTAHLFRYCTATSGVLNQSSDLVNIT
ncbi:MAG: hypothetical protein JW878_02690 [Methanomicrobia archaeon]|nr:hypothetical protein [Methanomicrobia archaeon]